MIEYNPERIMENNKLIEKILDHKHSGPDSIVILAKVHGCQKYAVYRIYKSCGSCNGNYRSDLLEALKAYDDRK